MLEIANLPKHYISYANGIRDLFVETKKEMTNILKS